ncbi:Lipoprotein signal peptidase [hydrothermal vent metagenome]|uniref:Lipoprotein signal peptidase n=1 Tax=hydrothermal vent metagenome TaxID=652676 RepID=A0A3B0W1Q3_9ZZZZ
MKKSVLLSLIVFLFGLTIDRAQKFYQINIKGWSGGEMINVTSFFDYILVWNKGVSFGLFSSLPPILLGMIISVALILLIVWWVKADDVLSRVGLALCVAGAISNIIDRFLYGAVADFFHFYWGQYSFYIFNIADVLISLGLIILLLEMVIPKKNTNDKLNKDKL